MAFASAPPHFSRRTLDHQERLIVNRRSHEIDTKQRWTEHLKFFTNSDINSHLQEKWTSSKSYQESMDAYHSMAKQEEKVKKLAERRVKLRSLLQQEANDLQKELAGLKSSKFSAMKERAEQLKSSREAERQKVAEEKLHEHWKLNCAELKRIESQQQKQAVCDEWDHQVKLKDEEKIKARKDSERYEEAVEAARIESLQRMEEEHKMKEEEKKHFAKVLQQQMEEIKAREKEAKLLSLHQAELLQEQLELEKMEEERQKLEQAQKQLELGRVLKRQHKALVRKRCQQIQESLNFDMKILEDLAKTEMEEQEFLTARRAKAKSDAEWMRRNVAEQLRKEKEREAGLDLLYQEEITRMWQKQESNWERERVAREKLMKEVLQERQDQIQRKMEELKLQQMESIQQREFLLKKMEEFSEMNSQVSELKKKKTAFRAQEIESQILERRSKAEEARLQYEKELEEQRRAEEAYELLLREEESKLTHRGYVPKQYSKKKYAWN